MVTMVCCNSKFETVQESIDGHPLDATTCASQIVSDDVDMVDADVTAELDELSRMEIVDVDTWIDEMMGVYATEDYS